MPLQHFVVVMLLSLSFHGSHAQRQVPPALASAQRASAAAAAAEAHTAALRGSRSDTLPGSDRTSFHKPRSGWLQQQQLQQQQQMRHLLAPEPGDKEPAAADKKDDGPFANLTVGNVTAARENALRKALLDGYDKGTFPWAEYGPAQVGVNLAIHKILGVDLYGGVLRLSVWLRQEWYDPRLTWDKREWNVSKVWFMNPQQGDTEIWEPDITLWNAATPILYTLGQEPLQVDSNGRVFWTRPGTFEVACNFKGLSAYPFGKVRCQLELGAWTYGPWYVNVSMKGQGYALGGSVTSGESAVWTEYKVQNVTAHRHTYPPYPCCPDESDWPVVLIEMALERQNLIYMMKVVVPQIILTAVAFSTFWLSPACGERLGLAVTVPLAVAVYDLLTFSQLPVSNKVTLVSAMGMLAFMFSMAVLIENAFVIQLWHYSEHTYFKGASLLAATAIAYREQLVWVQLLGCIHTLKIEVARRQLEALQARKKAASSSRERSWHAGRSYSPAAKFAAIASSSSSKGATPGLSKWQSLVADQRQQQQECKAGAEDDVETRPVDIAAAAGSGRTDSDRIELHGLTPTGSGEAGSSATAAPHMSVLGKAKSRVMQQLGELQTQLGVDQGQGDGGDSMLLSCTTKEQLRLHLHNILGSKDKALLYTQRRIQKAFLVFGEDVVCTRLHAVLSGGAQPVLDTASDAGSDCGDTSPGNLHERLAGEFNRRWQLLSMIIDSVCRYLFVSAYLISMLILSVVLIKSDE